MNTEITELERIKNVKGWVLFDADCPFCIRVADRLRTPLARRHLIFLPLQTPWIRNTLNLTETELLSEMRLLKPGGEVFGGVDAWLEISRHFWWTWPLRLLVRMPRRNHTQRYFTPHPPLAVLHRRKINRSELFSWFQ